MKEYIKKKIDETEKEICEEVERNGLEWEDHFFDGTVNSDSGDDMSDYEEADINYWNQLIGRRHALLDLQKHLEEGPTLDKAERIRSIAQFYGKGITPEVEEALYQDIVNVLYGE